MIEERIHYVCPSCVSHVDLREAVKQDGIGPLFKPWPDGPMPICKCCLAQTECYFFLIPGKPDATLTTRPG